MLSGFGGWGCLPCGCFSPLFSPASFLGLRSMAQSWRRAENGRISFRSSPPLVKSSGMQIPKPCCAPNYAAGIAVHGSSWVLTLEYLLLWGWVLQGWLTTVALLQHPLSLCTSIAGMKKKPNQMLQMFACRMMEKGTRWNESLASCLCQWVPTLMAQEQGEEMITGKPGILQFVAEGDLSSSYLRPVLITGS